MTRLKSKQIFIDVITSHVGETRIIADGGSEDGNAYLLELCDVDGMAETLCDWYADANYDEYCDNAEAAEEYFGETY
jgi:hypothetical protein